MNSEKRNSFYVYAILLAAIGIFCSGAEPETNLNADTCPNITGQTRVVG